MLLILFGKFFYIDRFTVFQNNMCGFDLWHMCLKNFCGIVHRHRDDRTSGFAGNFETSLMERKEFQFILVFVPGSFREDADGDAGFDLFNSGKDGFQSLFDILSVKEEAVEVTHPVGKQRVTFHFFLCNITGTDRAAAVGQQNVKITSVIRHIENSLIFRDILFTDDGDLGTCDPQDKFKYGLYHTQRADILGHWREFADDPFHQKNRDRQHQISRGHRYRQV